jgi:hypothetical protein
MVSMLLLIQVTGLSPTTGILAVASEVDEIFHKHGNADREHDPDHDNDCYVELHALT